MTTSLILFIFLDSIFIHFNFDEEHIEVVKTTLLTIIFLAYYGGRSPTKKPESSQIKLNILHISLYF